LKANVCSGSAQWEQGGQNDIASAGAISLQLCCRRVASWYLWEWVHIMCYRLDKKRGVLGEIGNVHKAFLAVYQNLGVDAGGIWGISVF
jgi:hypothetical protein